MVQNIKSYYSILYGNQASDYSFTWYKANWNHVQRTDWIYSLTVHFNELEMWKPAETRVRLKFCSLHFVY